VTSLIDLTNFTLKGTADFAMPALVYLIIGASTISILVRFKATLIPIFHGCDLFST
jgi:hypothetical protein